MKKSELKKMLKPLIKECIKECIFEDGVLSGIITEVANGLSDQRVVVGGLTVESKKSTGPDQEELARQANAAEEQRQERIKRLNESAKLGDVDVFAGTKSIAPETENATGALSGIASDDSGVDIGGILNLAEGKWKHLM
jgi:membrane protease subunit (stomatin/prohibitin family)